MVRRFDVAVYVAETRPQWPANEAPVNPATPLKQAVCGRGRAARGGYCILKPCRRERLRYWLFRSDQVEVACHNHRTLSVVASCV